MMPEPEPMLPTPDSCLFPELGKPFLRQGAVIRCGSIQYLPHHDVQLGIILVLEHPVSEFIIPVHVVF